MSDTSYYVYALKDPRSSPAMPFYIGKGTGTRSYDHLLRPDDSLKGQRIKEIVASGHKVLVTRLVNSLSEAQSLKLEAELISSFGTIETGGVLTNAVVPSGLGKKSRPSLTVPHGAQEKAQVGLSLLKEAVLEFAKVNPKGITNSDTASLLGLRSDYGGGSMETRKFFSLQKLGLEKSCKQELEELKKKRPSTQF